MNQQFDFVENGGVTSPAGFLACGVCAGFKRSGSNDMALIVSEKDCTGCENCVYVCPGMKNKKALEMVMNNEIPDGKTQILVLKAAVSNFVHQ